MKIKITRKKAEVSQQIQNLIEEKCAKLEKFVKVAEEVDIIFKEEKESVFAEINFPIKGAVIHAEAEAGDVLSAFEDALDKIEKQVKKHRGKITKHTSSCGSPRCPVSIVSRQ